MPSCGVRPSITFVNCVKTSNRILRSFSPSSPTILVFPHQTSWQYSDRDPLTGVSHAGGVDKIAILDESLVSIDDCWTCEQQLRPFTVQFTAQTATHQWIFVYHSLQHGRSRRREENRTDLFIRSGKSEAEVTNNRRLRSTYYTIEDNWQTWSIARPLCDLTWLNLFVVVACKHATGQESAWMWACGMYMVVMITTTTTIMAISCWSFVIKIAFHVDTLHNTI